MLLRRLVVRGDPPLAADLHPRITVLTGLGPAGRARVIAAVTGFLRGDGAMLEGTIEVEGVLFDIEPEVLDLLELPAGLPDIVISSGDLKRVLASADGTDVTSSARRAELDDELDRLNNRFGVVAAHRADVADAVDQADPPARPEPLLPEDADTGTGTYVPAGRDWSWTTPDPFAPPAGRGDEAPGGDETIARIDQVESQMDAIRRRLDELDQPRDAGVVPSPFEDDRDAWAPRVRADGVDTVPVAAALEALQWVRSWVPESRADTNELADRLAEVRRKKAMARPIDVPEWLRAQALQRLEEAQTELQRAEREVRPPQLDPDAAAALEVAHAAVDEAEDRAGRRLAGPMAQRKLAAARAEEAAILERLGMPSYAAFLLRRASAGNVDADGERRLAAARAALADAEAMWAEVEGGGDGTDFEALDEEERAARAAAVELLGSDTASAESELSLDQLEALLRDQRTPAPDWRPAAEGLVEALVEVGVDVPAFSFGEYDGDFEALEELAAGWLVGDRPPAADLEVVDDRFHAIERERAELQAELDGLRQEWDALRAAPAVPAEHGAAVVFESVAVIERADEAQPVFEPVPEAHVPEGPVPEVAAPAPSRRMSASERLRRLREEAEQRLDELSAEISLLGPAAEAPVEDAPAAPEPSSGPDAELAALDAEGAELAARIDEVSAARERLDEGPGDEPGGPVDALDALDDYLRTRFDAIDVSPEIGPLPVLIDEVLEGEPAELTQAVLDRLAEASSAAQVVVLSDQPDVSEWASQQGDDAWLVPFDGVAAIDGADGTDDEGVDGANGADDGADGHGFGGF